MSERKQFDLLHVPVAFGVATTWGDLRAMVDHATAYDDDDPVEVTRMWNDPDQLDAVVIRSDGPLGE